MVTLENNEFLSLDLIQGLSLNFISDINPLQLGLTFLFPLKISENL